MVKAVSPLTKTYKWRHKTIPVAIPPEVTNSLHLRQFIEHKFMERSMTRLEDNPAGENFPLKLIALERQNTIRELLKWNKVGGWTIEFTHQNPNIAKYASQYAGTRGVSAKISRPTELLTNQNSDDAVFASLNNYQSPPLDLSKVIPIQEKTNYTRTTLATLLAASLIGLGGAGIYNKYGSNNETENMPANNTVTTISANNQSLIHTLIPNITWESMSLSTKNNNDNSERIQNPNIQESEVMTVKDRNTFSGLLTIAHQNGLPFSLDDLNPISNYFQTKSTLHPNQKIQFKVGLNSGNKNVIQLYVNERGITEYEIPITKESQVDTPRINQRYAEENIKPITTEVTQNNKPPEDVKYSITQYPESKYATLQIELSDIEGLKDIGIKDEYGAIGEEVYTIAYDDLPEHIKNKINTHMDTENLDTAKVSLHIKGYNDEASYISFSTQ